MAAICGPLNNQPGDSNPFHDLSQTRQRTVGDSRVVRTGEKTVLRKVPA